MREDSTAYNAAEIIALHNELIGPVERERLQKALPWVRSLVNELIQRIANLRTMATEPDPAVRIADLTADRDSFRRVAERLQSEVTQLQSQLAAERERCASIADRWTNSPSCSSHDENPCCHVRTGYGIAAAIRQQDTESKEK